MLCGMATAHDSDALEFNVRPRVCTLSAADQSCHATVRAEWRSPRNESLCLVIVNRPDIKQCWDNFSQGVYSVEVAFTEDLLVQLRNVDLDRVLAEKAVAVIRQALRRKRRQPWNIF